MGELSTEWDAIMKIGPQPEPLDWWSLSNKELLEAVSHLLTFCRVFSKF